MPVLTTPVMQFVDEAGLPLAYAEAYFYATGTTTPATVFQDFENEVDHANPVVADANGYFPPIYFGPGQFRMKVIPADGDLQNPLIDVDPVNSSLLVTADDLADGAIEDKLGYTPFGSNGGTFLGQVRLNYVPTALAVDEAGFRGTPINIKNVSYEFVLNDSGRLIVKDEATPIAWTIPPMATVGFPLGTVIHVYNNDSEDVTITRGGGVSLLNEDGDDTNMALGPFAYAKLIKIYENTWIMRPSGEASGGGVDLTENGYVTFPNGYVRHWGKAEGPIAQNVGTAVTFSPPFPNACLGINVTPYTDTYDSQDDIWLQVVGSPTVNGATVYTQSSDDATIAGFYWEAWGH